MKNTFSHINTALNGLEVGCIELIENELNTFFDTCSKSAFSYSLFISQNYRNHSKENFEKMVLNNEEVLNFMKEIINKLNNFLNDFTFIYEEEIGQAWLEKYIYLNTLNNTVIQNKTTHNITIYCEKVIDESILEAFNLFCPGLISEYLLSQINFGRLILGRNNSIDLTNKNVEEMHSQIKGILMNIKMDVRNLILKSIIKQIKDYSYINKIA